MLNLNKIEVLKFYKSNNIADRIKIQAYSNDLSLNKILENCGLGKNTISHIKAGSIPRADNLAKIADELGCSVDYLLGRTNNPEINH